MPAPVSRRRLLQLAAGTAVIGGTGVLASCGGTGGVSNLTGSLITRWREDPFARGSYSYLAAGSTPVDRDAIAAPVGDRLFFAGEATSRGFPATVQGAFLSGQRAAREVIAAGGGRTIVVGAGMAGLGAARELDDQGQETIVLEARDRIGGRVWTDDALSAPVDLGASWIHGARGNPMAEIADELDLELSRTRYANRVIYSATGQRIRERNVPEARQLVSADAARANPTDPVGRYLRPERAGGAQAMDLARFVATTEIEHEFAASIDDLSIAAISEGRALRGGDFLIPAGYATIADALLGGFDLRLKSEIERITHDPGGVLVTGKRGEEVADRVIVTVPLGVLKAETIKFSPALPDAKLTAISRLGMGLLDKVVMQFDEVFWNRDADIIDYVTPDGGSFAEWLNVFRYTGEPIIVGFNAADYAERIERDSDEEIIDKALGTLRAIYG